MSDKLLDQLNEAQREAASCVEGPLMIIAGAGSGKTRTLTYRIAHLIELGVDPFNILALTFTNKAAEEMKDRIISLVGNSAKNLWMGTFHSVFAKVLRADADKLGYIRSFSIYDNDDSKSMIKSIVKQMDLDPKSYSPGYVLSRISMAKSNLIGPEDYANNPEIIQTDVTAKRPEIATIYNMYNKRLRNSMAMDFDDLLFNMNVLLRDFPDVLLKYQNRFHHILVDEYQDTNYSQYLIVKKLAARYENICVVGDDAQSIYAFRGANIQNIFNFKRDYPNMHLFKLEQNYRSTQNIVNAANSIISNNRDQIQKEIWTDNLQGNLLRLIRASDERDEGNKVADSIQNERLANDLEYKDFAILYRTNAQSRSIEEALRKMNIPYRIYQGLSFYGRKEIKDVLAYMKLVVNNHDNESLTRIINYPPRGIGQTTMDKIITAANDNEVSVWTVLENLKDFGLGIMVSTERKIDDFVSMISRFTSSMYSIDAYNLARHVLAASGLQKHLLDDDDPENTNRIENIEELLNAVKEFCDSEDEITPDTNEETSPEFKTLDLFLQQVLLLTSEDKEKDNPNKVSMMTIHAAKGLEFPYVYVVGMEENLFPSIMSLSSRPDLEEERRLFYVAVTRAEKQLTLSYAQTRYQYGQQSYQELSRFVEEIDERYIEMPSQRKRLPEPGQLPRAFFNAGKPKPKTSSKQPAANGKKQSPVQAPTAGNTPAEINRIQVGMNVEHGKFGRGKVMTVEGEGDSRKAIVFFEGVGQKQLLLKFAKLTIIE